jgi:hypothetical protein
VAPLARLRGPTFVDLVGLKSRSELERLRGAPPSAAAGAPRVNNPLCFARLRPLASATVALRSVDHFPQNHTAHGDARLRRIDVCRQ